MSVVFVDFGQHLTTRLGMLYRKAISKIGIITNVLGLMVAHFKKKRATIGNAVFKTHTRGGPRNFAKMFLHANDSIVYRNSSFQEQRLK